ncbi:MAG: PQQ-like beta-propeller repeat protein [Verrucomicrobiales bacterium]|nr:PQQ-like beta-propeller repeat protein [Verrucomicrobiales bacterium]
MKSVASLALAWAVLTCSSPTATAESWTHYRGPTHDGIYAAPIRTDWNAQPPRRLWRIPMGPALSSLSIAGGRVFTQARRNVSGEPREFTVALDTATGRELWAVNLDVADYPDGGVGSDDGPRSTPVIDGDRVYVFTSYLRLVCLEAASGREVWRRDFRAELGANVIDWQNAASPLVLGDLIFINANTSPDRITAVRKSDGTTAWRDHDERMTQSTPVYATIAGVPQVVFFTQAGLLAVKPEDGTALWRFPFSFSTSTAASPVVASNLVYCSAAYGVGAGAARITPSGNGLAAAQAWKSRNANMNHWSTPVHHQGFLYGVYGQSSLSLRCVNAATGAELWREPSVDGSEVGYGSILKVQDLLLVQTESGRLALGAPNTNGFTVLASFQGAEGKCWNTPALSDGILYARSTSEVVAYDVAPPRPATPLQFKGVPSIAQGRARLSVATPDGSAVDATRLTKLRLLSSTSLASPVATWTVEDAAPSLQGNEVRFDAPFRDADAQRYFQLREQP